MARIGEQPPSAAGARSLLWSHREVPVASITRTRGHNVNVAWRDVPLDYAVMTENSAFPAGWVRFNKDLACYVFSSLLQGQQIPAAMHSDPGQAVPAWVGAYTLKAIHPIPEEVTGDMLAAAPAMLALLKQVRALMAEDESRLPGLDLDDLDHVVAIAEGRG